MKAKGKGISFNAYVESVLRESIGEEVPFIDSGRPVPTQLLFDDYPELPTREEVLEDPRLQAILGV